MPASPLCSWQKELLRVLHLKFQWNEDALGQAEEDIRSYTNRVSPSETLDVIKLDPPDNRILECAVAAKSDYIVTGDTRHILPLQQYVGMPIVKPAAFLDLLLREFERNDEPRT